VRVPARRRETPGGGRTGPPAPAPRRRTLTGSGQLGLTVAVMGGALAVICAVGYVLLKPAQDRVAHGGAASAVVRTVTCQKRECDATVAFRVGSSPYMARFSLIQGTHLREGQTVRVRYDRSDPHRAQVPGVSESGPGWLLFLALLLGALAIAGAVMALRGRHAAATELPRAREEPVLYREGGRRWPLPAFLLAVAAVFFALRLSGDADHAYGALVFAVILLLFVVGPLTVGAWLYSRVLVTTTELRVGSERVSLADVDHHALERELATDGTAPQHANAWRGEGPKPLGGATKPSFGKRHLLLKLEGDDRPRAVPTRHPDRLGRVLDQAINAR